MAVTTCISLSSPVAIPYRLHVWTTSFIKSENTCSSFKFQVEGRHRYPAIRRSESGRIEWLTVLEGRFLYVSIPATTASKLLTLPTDGSQHTVGHYKYMDQIWSRKHSYSDVNAPNNTRKQCGRKQLVRCVHPNQINIVWDVPYGQGLSFILMRAQVPAAYIFHT